MHSKPDLTHIDVRYIADLARIALADDEVERFQKELDDTLAYVAHLSELDVSDIAATTHVAIRTNVLRDDVVGASLPREHCLRNAPATLNDEFIRVPPVMDGDDEGDP